MATTPPPTKPPPERVPEHGRPVELRAGKWKGREVVHQRAPVDVLPPLDLDGLKLNLGAGWDGTEGFIRVDRAGDPDIRLDLSEPLPFADGTFVEIRAFHVLEHIERRDLVRIMNECWRVLEPDGVMEIEVPVFPSDAAMADPTHVSFFVAATFDYFNKGSQFDGERMLYGIKPWALTDRKRDAMAVFLRVRLRKLPNDLDRQSEGDRNGYDRYVTAGVGPEGTGFAPVADSLDRALGNFHPCCGAPKDAPHLGTCDMAPARGGGG